MTKDADTTTANPLRDDLIEGVEAIAAELGWSVRRVYHVMEQQLKRDEEGPIRKKPGTPIYAFRSELEKFLRGTAANEQDIKEECIGT